MTEKIRIFRSIFHSMGLKWIIFRAAYSFRKKIGLLKLQVPAYAWEKYQIGDRIISEIPSDNKTYAQWKKDVVNSQFPNIDMHYIPGIHWDKNLAVQASLRFLKGEVKYFSNEVHQIGFPPDWLKDPFSQKKYDSGLHWSQLPDYGDSDIKFVWEVNRFSWVVDLVRAYAVEQDDRFAQAFWTCLEDWMEKNPPGSGPNWKDGQEVALRLMAACFGFIAFINHDSTTDQRISRFTLFISAHAQRIHQNLDFAISTRSNHTISEAFGLWLAGLLFPELKMAEKYRSTGRKILEKEIHDQFLPDGGYAMYSLNYHRFVLHIYLLAIQLARKTGNPFSEILNQTIAKSVDMIYQMMNKSTGQIPFFGSNDGALILPLNNCDFNDFRPLVQTGHYLFRQKRLFDPGPWDEDLFWFFGSDALKAPKEEILPNEGKQFPDSGIYRINSSHSHATIRSVHFTARPSHADQLHMDFWWFGHYLTYDAGTFLYNGKTPWQNGLSGTDVHNTISVDGQDQMRRLSRITWLDWANGSAEIGEGSDGTLFWKGSHNGYHRLADPVDHFRKVFSIGDDRWLVMDQLIGKTTHRFRLHWLFEDIQYQSLDQGNGFIFESPNQFCKVQIGSSSEQSEFSLIRADPLTTRGWRSKFYAQKESAISIALVVDNPRTAFWTYFGFPQDQVTAKNQQLYVTVNDHSHRIDLWD